MNKPTIKEQVRTHYTAALARLGVNEIDNHAFAVGFSALTGFKVTTIVRRLQEFKAITRSNTPSEPSQIKVA